VRTSQRGIRQIDGRAKSRVARLASQPDVELIIEPETTNIKGQVTIKGGHLK
jgi:hypothetical protein